MTEKVPDRPPAAPRPVFIPRSPLTVAAYMLAATVIALTQGLGLSFLSTNINLIAGPLGATTREASWLMAAYLIPNASLTLMLYKMRTQFGLRKFAELSIVVYVLVSLAHFWVDDLPSALAVRFVAGVAASPMSSLAFLYMLETIPPAKKVTLGLSLAMTALSLSTPVAGLVSPVLMDIGGWKMLYIAECGLAMICLAAIYLLPLAPAPRMKVIGVLDVVSYLSLAAGMGALAILLILGRLYWWFEAPWLGWVLVTGIVCVTALSIIELNRADPMLDIRWLTSKEIIHFTGALLFFRLMLSEQSAGAVAFFRQMGLNVDQMAVFYWAVLVAGIAAGLTCAAIMKPGREGALHVVALSLLAIAAFRDSHVTSLTRPEDMIVSQVMIAFASGLFLPPAMAVGLTAAMREGPQYLISFIVVFLTTQKIGGVFGSAVFGTFVTWREQLHSSALVQHLTLADPSVAQRIAQYGGAYAKVLADPLVRQSQGLALLDKAVRQQAYVLAYGDAFLLTGIAATGGLALLLIHLAWRNANTFLGRPAAISA